MPSTIFKATLALLVLLPQMTHTGGEQKRPRARDIGLVVGVLPPGRLDAITDVEGVRVGHATLIRGEDVRTGVTAILPHGGNLFQEKVPAAVFVGNGFGKLTGSTQVGELGEIETPILLTNTLNVPRVADALVDWMLALPGNEDVRSVNPVVAETNDGQLNDIRGRHVRAEDVFAALKSAKGGEVEEGSVGAGTGTVAFGFKGGIGTASRVVPARYGGYTVGVLVQTNFGGVLTINGAPVGRELGRYYLKEDLEPAPKSARREKETNEGRDRKDEGRDRKEPSADADRAEASRNPDRPFSLDTDRSSSINPDRSSSSINSDRSSLDADRADGSVIVVVATDAPLDARNLRRLAARAMLGLARTGSPSTNGSGDYVIAFSTALQNRIKYGETAPRRFDLLPNDSTSPLFLACVEATEEAVYNSLLRATTVTGRGGARVEALPIERTIEILKKYNALRPGESKH
ncbi:MAG TPA: P1 family peptidase [Pyrinomonadaceae bacterium]|nr:P1 family peptidase [Pyrinomonadaceae bacterium]